MQDSKATQIASELNRPIEAHDSFFRNLLTPTRTPTDPERLYRGLLAVFSGKHANPSNPTRAEVSGLLYCRTPLRKISGENPEDIDSEQFLAIIAENSNVNHFVLQGLRGAGKTAFMNHLLTVKFDTLTSIKYTFFRADIEKLHSLINSKRLSANRSRITVQQYFMLHAFMVALQHADSKTDLALQRFKPDKQLSPYVQDKLTPFENFLSTPNLSSDNHQLKLWKAVRRIYFELSRDERGSRAGSDVAIFIERCMNFISDPRSEAVTAQWDARSEVLGELYGKFVQYIGSECPEFDPPLPPVRILSIFESVDNLRFSEIQPQSAYIAGKPSRYWYFKYLNDLSDIALGGANAVPGAKFLYVIRDITCIDFMRLTTVIGNLPELPVYEISAPRPRDLVKKKIHAAKTSPGNVGLYDALSESERREVIPGDHTEAINALTEFEIFADLYFEQLSGLVSRVESIPSINADQAVDVVFSRNIRSFSRNIIRTFSAYSLYVRQRERRSLRNTSLGSDEWKETYKKHLNIIPEISLLSGQAYMFPSEFNSGYGRWMPSAFEFRDLQNHSIWGGICMPFMLEILPDISSHDVGPSGKLLIEAMGNLSMDTADARRILFVLFDYGLITFQTADGEDNLPLHLDEDTYLLRALQKTHKGAFVRKLMFYSPEFFYLVATGGKYVNLPISRIGEGQQDTVDRRRAAGYLHNAVSPRHFSLAVLRLGALAIRHFQSTLNLLDIPMRKMQQIADEHDGNTGGSPPAYPILGKSAIALTNFRLEFGALSNVFANYVLKEISLGDDETRIHLEKVLREFKDAASLVKSP